MMPAAALRLVPARWSPGSWPWSQFVVAQGTVFAFAALILARRSVGALERPAPLPAACAAVLAASALASIGGRGIKWHAARPGRKLIQWLPTLGVLLLAMMLAPPWAPAAPAHAIWPLAALSEIAWLAALRRRASRASQPVQSASAPAVRRRHAPKKPGRVLVQRLVRRTIEEGGEEIDGLMAVPVAAGQRLATAHAAFCPPLAAPPQMNCRLNDSSGLEAGAVRAAFVQSFGARFDVKLAKPAPRARTYWLSFSARAAAPHVAASPSAELPSAEPAAEEPRRIRRIN